MLCVMSMQLVLAENDFFFRRMQYLHYLKRLFTIYEIINRVITSDIVICKVNFKSKERK
jgi:hypothetical protein